MFLLSAAIKPKLSVNNLLYTSKARGIKYFKKYTSWPKIPPTYYSVGDGDQVFVSLGTSQQPFSLMSAMSAHGPSPIVNPLENHTGPNYKYIDSKLLKIKSLYIPGAS